MRTDRENVIKKIREMREAVDDLYQLQSDEETEYCSHCGEPMDVCTCQYSQPEISLVNVDQHKLGFIVEIVGEATLRLTREQLSQLAYKAEAALQDRDKGE